MNTRGAAAAGPRPDRAPVGVMPAATERRGTRDRPGRIRPDRLAVAGPDSGGQRPARKEPVAVRVLSHRVKGPVSRGI